MFSHDTQDTIRETSCPASESILYFSVYVRTYVCGTRHLFSFYVVCGEVGWEGAGIFSSFVAFSRFDDDDLDHPTPFVLT